jgi:hypothetical protein
MALLNVDLARSIIPSGRKMDRGSLIIFLFVLEVFSAAERAKGEGYWD